MRGIDRGSDDSTSVDSGEKSGQKGQGREKGSGPSIFGCVVRRVLLFLQSSIPRNGCSRRLPGIRTSSQRIGTAVLLRDRSVPPPETSFPGVFRVQELIGNRRYVPGRGQGPVSKYSAM